MDELILTSDGKIVGALYFDGRVVEVFSGQLASSRFLVPCLNLKQALKQDRDRKSRVVINFARTGSPGAITADESHSIEVDAFFARLRAAGAMD